MNKKLIVLVWMIGFVAPVLADVAYVVRPGDTILKIADRLIAGGQTNLSRYQMANRIRAKNPQIKDFNVLEVGDQLQLPDVTPSTPAVSTHGNVVPAAEPEAVQATAEPPLEPQTSTQPQATLEQQTPVEQQVPVASTDSQTTSAPTPEHNHPNFLSVEPRFEHHAYDVKVESTHQVLKTESEIVAGLGLGYGWSLSDSTHLIFEAGANYTQLKKFPDASLDGTTQWLKSFGVGIEYELASSLKVELLALYNDYLVILPDQAAGFSAKIVSMPGAELVFDWSFLKFTASEVGATLGAEYSTGASKHGTKFDSSLEPLASLYWQTSNDHQINYKVEATYTMNAQHAEHEAEQEVKMFGLNLELTLPL